jgi:hypothetical protein
MLVYIFVAWGAFMAVLLSVPLVLALIAIGYALRRSLRSKIGALDNPQQQDVD